MLKKYVIGALTAIAILGIAPLFKLDLSKRMEELPVLGEVLPFVKNIANFPFVSSLALITLLFIVMSSLIRLSRDERNMLWEMLENLITQPYSVTRQDLETMLKQAQDDGYSRQAIEYMEKQYLHKTGNREAVGKLKISKYTQLVSKYGHSSIHFLFQELVDRHCQLTSLRLLVSGWELTPSSRVYLMEFHDATLFKMNLRGEFWNRDSRFRELAIHDACDDLEIRQLKCLARAVNGVYAYTHSLDTGLDTKECMENMEQRMRELHSLPGKHPTQSELMEFCNKVKGHRL